MTKISRSIALLIGLLSPLSLFAQNSDNSQRPDVIPGEVHRPVQFVSGDRAVRDMPDQIPDKPARGGRDFEPGRPFPIGNSNPATENTYGPIGVGATSAQIEPKASTQGVPVDPNYRVAPPDTTGDIGGNYYVQWVNLRYSVYTVSRDANGISGFTLVGGFPKQGNTIFSPMGGACASNNDGDPLVQYDQGSGRWILTQFSVSTTPYLQCVAVSKTSDPTGQYNYYAYSFGTDFNDFPKMGIWNDSYVITYNMFKRGRTFGGSSVCAYDRAAMIAGSSSAKSICTRTSTSYASLLPADVEGSANPPSGSAVPLLSLTSTSVLSWKYAVNWAAGTATLTGPTTVSGVSTFSRACSGGTCIPQPGTTNKLDSLGDRLNYRLSYRNFGTREALLVNHAVAANGGTGIRWYEFQNVTSGTFGIRQQGTYAPDSSYRWMGSAAMDKTGGIAIGYNISNATTINPSIKYAFRGPGDSLGTLGGETNIFSTGASQTGTLARWGDYSTLSVDPADDCTMVFTTEYIPSNGNYNWSTYIGSFKLSTCQ